MRTDIKIPFLINIKEVYILLKRLFVVLFLFTILRIVFYIFNIEHFEGMTFSHFLRIMHGGFRFDLSAIMFINFLYIFLFLLPFPFKYNRKYQSFLKYLFLISNSIAVAFNMGDVFYFDFILKRSTADVFMFAGESNILKLFSLFFIDYWYGVLIGISLIISFILIHNRIKLKRPERIKKTPYFLTGLVILCLSAYFSVIGMRGSFVKKTFPITLGDAGIYVNKTEEMALVLNTPFTILKTLEKRALKEKKYFDNDELSKYFSPIHTIDTGRTFKDMNVVIIVMESFSREYIGSLNTDIDSGNYIGYTPFLDSLINKSKVFIRTFANGRISIEALPAITSSIPSTIQSHVTSPYASNKIYGLGNLLKKKGYHTSFFHGAPKGALGLEAFMKISGYDHSFSMKEYGNNEDYDGSWGLWDEEFFQYFADKLNNFKQPFHSVFFSISSHHPFKIPKKYTGKFEEGKLPIHKTVRYSDMALRKFFSRISGESWYNNTLFVITADHSNQTYFKKYNSSVGKYAIPLVLYSPSDSLLTGIDSTIAQQIDIMPTVLEYLNYDEDFFSFGNNLLNDNNQAFALNYLNDTYQIIIDDFMLQFRGEKAVGFYNYEKDHSLSNNLINKFPSKQVKLENKLKAFIQDYNRRMIADRLYISE